MTMNRHAAREFISFRGMDVSLKSEPVSPLGSAGSSRFSEQKSHA